MDSLELLGLQKLNGLNVHDIVVAFVSKKFTQLQKCQVGKFDMNDIFDDLWVIVVIFVRKEVRRWAYSHCSSLDFFI